MTPSLLALALWSCTDSTITTEQRCEVTLTELVPDSGSVGDAIALTADPLTDTFDTALYVGGVRAEVSSVTREGCDDCDDCVEEAACNVCGDCDACDLLCEQECLEIVTFVVPEVGAGSTTVQLFNNHGGSTILPFTVLGTGDTGDTGSGDSGDSGDTGPGTSPTDTADTGTTDSGDTDPIHTGDTAPADTGSIDTGDTATGDSGDSASGGTDTGGEDTAAPAPPWRDPFPTCPVTP